MAVSRTDSAMTPEPGTSDNTKYLLLTPHKLIKGCLHLTAQSPCEIWVSHPSDRTAAVLRLYLNRAFFCVHYICLSTAITVACHRFATFDSFGRLADIDDALRRSSST